MRKRSAIFFECLRIRIGYLFGRYTEMEKDLAIGYIMTRDEDIQEIQLWQLAAFEIWDEE